ncbi:hypothetical protein LTR62_006911 [Meristemomyces frigidus]|uniref:Uncharacterized protein n=1 Tax=Meristemomyces frigidus TaxID=1508187 RepID=A0AAN7TCE4_9PEZI|nr:hypothetical protein LTR62_006911 [Meristemomyces frigidus]
MALDTVSAAEHFALKQSTNPNRIIISNPPNHPPAVPSYSHISTVPLSPTTRLVSFAGQTYKSLLTPTPPPPFQTQVRLALENVDKCMAFAGVSKRDIVSNRQYCVKLQGLSQEDQDARSVIFLEWWNDRGAESGGGGGASSSPRDAAKENLAPPDTLIGVDSLASKDILYEIEITCVAPMP